MTNAYLPYKLCKQFQPTPSAWRVTDTVDGFVRVLRISTHTLRVEGDTTISDGKTADMKFQPTPSAWRVTKLTQFIRDYRKISTHTLRVEGDLNLVIEQ